MPRYKKKRQTRAIRGKAQDGFSNALARLGVGTPNLLEATEYIPQRITRNYALPGTVDCPPHCGHDSLGYVEKLDYVKHRSGSGNDEAV